jgi:vacuolar-type H+-ATPase subunit I/STV1
MGKDQRVLNATIALCVYLTSFPILGYTHLVWWKHAREARMLEEGLTSRPLFHQARAVLKRLLARFVIGIGWMLVSFFGFGISTLYREAGRKDIADVLFEYGGWLLFIVYLVTFLFLGFWIKSLVEIGYELLARAAKRQPPRLGGWLFVACGLLCLPLSFVPLLRLWVIAPLILLVGAFLYLYSYLCFRRGQQELLSPPFAGGEED